MPFFWLIILKKNKKSYHGKTKPFKILKILPLFQKAPSFVTVLLLVYNISVAAAAAATTAVPGALPVG